MNMIKFLFCAALPVLLSFVTCTNTKTNPESPSKHPSIEQNANLAKAYFAAGCFWCVEAIFESVKGVSEVYSGYIGGTATDANYADVSAGRTDHAEAVEVLYDPNMIDYKTLLVVFFGSQDPTTKNRQGPDAGRQYRSSIFYQNRVEQELSQAFIDSLNRNNVFPNPVVTNLEPFEKFYMAEPYHQDYERLNPNHPYVRKVSIPRLKRFKKAYPHLLKQ